MTGFSGKVVVVTGAASGIGWEMAKQFNVHGATVYAADIQPSGVPDGTIPVALDVRSETAFRSTIDRVINDQKKIDVLCNNAGVGSTTNPVECTTDEWDYVFSVNVRGAFIGAKFVLPHMLSAHQGVIINTASVAGMVGLPDRTSYCASKGAVVALTKQIAVQYAATGVRCNCLCPGTVDSPWVGRLLAEAPDATEARDALVARQPMGRLGTCAEVAAAALYLAGDDAAFMTGAQLVIDGGLTAA